MTQLIYFFHSLQRSAAMSASSNYGKGKTPAKYLIRPEGEDCSKHSVTLARLLWVEWFLPLLAWHRRESLAIAMEQRYPTFGRVRALVHPIPHPRDEPALVDLGAAAPGVVVPLTGEGMDQPGGLGAQDVEQVLVGQ